ncbi:unnamed protein product [Prunus brigantina]
MCFSWCWSWKQERSTPWTGWSNCWCGLFDGWWSIWDSRLCWYGCVWFRLGNSRTLRSLLIHQLLWRTHLRAFSGHLSRPFFLVGSSNTHIYLWEFGKDETTATYGVLPAANIPAPYALGSISASQFDHCGHRFATAA